MRNESSFRTKENLSVISSRIAASVYAIELYERALEINPGLKNSLKFKDEFGVRPDTFLKNIKDHVKRIPPEYFSDLAYHANEHPDDMYDTLYSVHYEGFEKIKMFLRMCPKQIRFFLERKYFPLAALICTDIGTTEEEIEYYFGDEGLSLLREMKSCGLVKIHVDKRLRAYTKKISCTVDYKKNVALTMARHLRIESSWSHFDRFDGYISAKAVDLIYEISRNHARVERIKITRDNQGEFPIFGCNFNTRVLRNNTDAGSEFGVYGSVLDRKLQDLKTRLTPKQFVMEEIKNDIHNTSTDDLYKEKSNLEMNISAVNAKGFHLYKEFCYDTMSDLKTNIFDNSEHKRNSKDVDGIFYSVGFFCDKVLNFI